LVAINISSYRFLEVWPEPEELEPLEKDEQEDREAARPEENDPCSHQVPAYNQRLRSRLRPICINKKYL
jgi:hypothetical protein